MERGLRRFIFISSAIVLLLAALISPFASNSPDGLEKVAEDKGFLHLMTTIWKYSPFPDYSFSGIANKYISTGLAGIIGVVIIFAITLIVARKIIKPSRDEKVARDRTINEKD